MRETVSLNGAGLRGAGSAGPWRVTAMKSTCFLFWTEETSSNPISCHPGIQSHLFSGVLASSIVK